MSEGTYTNLLAVTIDGAPLPATVKPLLVEGWVDASVNVPAAFQLTFRDPHQRVLGRLGVTIGSKVVLRALAVGKDGGSPLFTGEVTALEADCDGTGKYSVVRGHDPGHRLLRHRRVEGYVNMTASDIARRLAARDGLKIGKIDATKTVYELITQPNVTDWDFLTRLAQENDVEMSFDDKGRFQFVKPADASGAPGAGTHAKDSHHVLEFGVNLLRVRTGVTASDQVKEVEVRGWDVAGKQPLTSRAPATSNPELKIGTTGGVAIGKFGPATLVETSVPYDRQAEVKGAADALAADVSAAFAEVEAIVRGDPKLRPGLPVALNGIGKPFEGKYTVTTVRHVFAGGERYESYVTVTGRQHRSLFGLASGGGQPAPRMDGVVIAIVTDVQDPRRQGRVRLRFPWLDDKYVSDWARVVQFGGRGGGSLIMPEVNDEVLVAFDRGALDHPYVLGGLYNGVDKPPRYERLPLVGAGGKVNWRALASRSGQRIEMLDAPGKRGVTVSSGDDRMSVELNELGTRVKVHSDGTVEIRGARGVTVDGGATVQVNGAAIDIKGAEIGMEAAMLKITGMVEVQGKVNVMGVIQQNEMPVMVIPA
ncbi:VgrG-related protein [Actinomadura rupiterrae]|uniref:VgrG-related protein n=1 Tax=Actinomadura rupiterrae TaxID=559627 RepID=UPI0020A479DA|nr:VgrG-related protein [Actinomadura rupiterrae]MCP2342442.1 phage protein D/phage baseplate assembly protein gpV [Actinomadura rupiterrae]